MKRTLVLGLGNPILSDDSVGLRVVQELQKILLPRKDLVIDEDHWGGLRLMERLAGFDRAIIIDAIQSGAAPGTIRCLHPNEIPTQHSASTLTFPPPWRSAVRWDCIYPSTMPSS